MGELFYYVDDLGPSKVVHVHEPTHGLRAVLVIDNVAAGPSIGGLRLAPDVSTRECVRLARAMTLKNAWGGCLMAVASRCCWVIPRCPVKRRSG